MEISKLLISVSRNQGLGGYETEAGIIKGKFFYMSPEQARGEELDSRTDVFSLGIVLWELVTGELLYKDDDEVTLLSQVRRAVIRPPKEIRPDIPDALNRIIMKALARSRDERYASAFEMQKELERFLVRYNSKYGKDQVGYWMRSTFYEELPAKEVQNLDSFRHRADFLADEHSLIGQGIHTEDKTKPQTGEESSLMEIGSDVLESLDELTSSSVVVSQGVGAGEEFFDDAVTAAVDGLSDETGARLQRFLEFQGAQSHYLAIMERDISLSRSGAIVLYQDRVGTRRALGAKGNL